jgi:hypothetical protein
MITFKTQYHADVMMFDGIAIKLIKLMGHSGTVPSALNPDDVSEALNKLQTAIAKPSPQSGDSWDDDSVSLAHRAAPLLDLLTTAAENEEHVIWEKS